MKRPASILVFGMIWLTHIEPSRQNGPDTWSQKPLYIEDTFKRKNYYLTIEEGWQLGKTKLTFTSLVPHITTTKEARESRLLIHVNGITYCGIKTTSVELALDNLGSSKCKNFRSGNYLVYDPGSSNMNLCSGSNDEAAFSQNACLSHKIFRIDVDYVPPQTTSIQLIPTTSDLPESSSPVPTTTVLITSSSIVVIPTSSTQIVLIPTSTTISTTTTPVSSTSIVSSSTTNIPASTTTITTASSTTISSSSASTIPVSSTEVSTIETPETLIAKTEIQTVKDSQIFTTTTPLSQSSTSKDGYSTEILPLVHLMKTSSNIHIKSTSTPKDSQSTISPSSSTIHQSAQNTSSTTPTPQPPNGFGQWSLWSSCSATCNGTKQRSRECFDYCYGDSLETEQCGVAQCPIHGGFRQWTKWSNCTKECNNGLRYRERKCDQPRPQFNGFPCYGVTNETELCNVHLCPVDAIWSEWSPWSGCDKPCNNGSYIRKRFCTNAMYEGINRCGHEDVQIDKSSCNQHNCPRTYADMVFSLMLPYQQDYSNKYSEAFRELETKIREQIRSAYIDVFEENKIYNVILHSAKNGSVVVNLTIEFTSFDSFQFIVLQDSVEVEYAINKLILKPNQVVQYKIGPDVPELPPTDLTSSSLDAFALLLEWTQVEREKMNGEPQGYVVKVFNAKRKYLFTHRTGALQNYIEVNNLEPNTAYLFEICPQNILGLGPCDVIMSKTVSSVPTAVPQNLTSSETRSHNYLHINWSPPPESQLYGDLVSYKIKWSDAQNLVISKGEKTLHPLTTSYKLTNLAPNTKYQIELRAINTVGIGPAAIVSAETCKCPEKISTSYFLMPPYTDQRETTGLDGIFYELLQQIIPEICGDCQRSPKEMSSTKIDFDKNGRGVIAQQKTVGETVKQIDQFTDIIFPIAASTHAELFMNYPFIRLIEHPGIVLITRDKLLHEVVVNKIVSILNLWPLVILDILIMLVSGFFVWLLDGQINRDGDFSSKIIQGLQEGWYWAFITQGTHGYGDFKPVHFHSRLVAVLYIVVAMVMNSLLVGAIVANLTATEEKATNIKIYGTKLGAINGSFEEHIGLLRNGKMNTERNYTSAEELRQALLSHQVEGILVDAYSAGHNNSIFHHPLFRVSDVLYYPRSYGFVFAGQMSNMATEARDYIAANQQDILNYVAQHTSKSKKQEQQQPKSIFDSNTTVYQTSLRIMGSLILCATVGGLFFQYFVIVKKKRKISQLVDTKHRYQEMNNLVTSFQQGIIQSMNTYEQNNKSICVNYYLRKMKTKSNWLARKIYKYEHKDERRRRILKHRDGELGSVTATLQRRVFVVSNAPPCCSNEERQDSMLTLTTDVDGCKEY
ncbi:uncharacterized protein [Clytia hemisphaerica]|uniref:Fibronectin type-III domain-containing protein n=1 Tax=Clytia hemisphaerica TaxID=252671 RepID=A0A7M5V5N8_9CNID